MANSPEISRLLEIVPERTIVSPEYGTVRLIGFNALSAAQVEGILLPEEPEIPEAA